MLYSDYNSYVTLLGILRNTIRNKKFQSEQVYKTYLTSYGLSGTLPSDFFPYLKLLSNFELSSTTINHNSN